MDAETFVARARAESLGEVYRQTPEEVARGETRVRSAVRRLARNAPMVLVEDGLPLIDFVDAYVILALADGERWPGPEAERDLVHYRHGRDRSLFTRAKLILDVMRVALDEPWTDPIERKYVPAIANLVAVVTDRRRHHLINHTAILTRFVADEFYGQIVRDQVSCLWVAAKTVWGNKPLYNLRTMTYG